MGDSLQPAGQYRVPRMTPLPPLPTAEAGQNELGRFLLRSAIDVYDRSAGVGAHDVTLRDDHAFVVDGDYGLYIVDLRNPAAPLLVSTVEIGAWVNRVALSDGHAFLATDQGVHVVDVTDLRNPRPVGVFVFGDSGFGNRAFDIALNGSIAYVSMCCERRGVAVLDVSDPSAPALVEHLRLGGEVPGADVFTYQLTLSGDAVFLRVKVDHLDVNVKDEEWTYILEISEAAAPVLRGQFADPAHTLHRPPRVHGRFGYAPSYSGIAVLEMSDPFAPRFVSIHEAPGYVTDLEVAHDHLFVADTDFFRVIDITDPAYPRDVGRYDMRGGLLGLGGAGGDLQVTVSDTYAVVTHPTSGLTIFDIRPFRVGAGPSE